MIEIICWEWVGYGWNFDNDNVLNDLDLDDLKGNCCCLVV